MGYQQFSYTTRLTSDNLRLQEKCLHCRKARHIALGSIKVVNSWVVPFPQLCFILYHLFFQMMPCQCLSGAGGTVMTCNLLVPVLLQHSAYNKSTLNLTATSLKWFRCQTFRYIISFAETRTNREAHRFTLWYSPVSHFFLTIQVYNE